MAAKLKMEPTRKAVAELMLAMEIEKRRKASLELNLEENKSESNMEDNLDNSNAEEGHSEYNYFDVRTVLLDMKKTNKKQNKKK